jgi:hypothetical protein
VKAYSVVPAAIVSCLCTTILYGQVSTPKWEVGVNVSAFIYQGDLAPSKIGSYKTPGAGFGIYANRILNDWFSLRTSFVFGELRGDDSKYASPAWRQQRNLNFRTSVYEFSEMIVWNILGNNYDRSNGYDRTGSRLTPYLFGGIGYSFLHIRRDASKFNTHYFVAGSKEAVGLAADEAHSLPKGIPVIPVGAGVRYGLSQALSATAEIAYRATFTDYLDGFSKVANPSRNDHYYSVSVGLVYRFGTINTLKCPVLRY